MYGNQIIKGLKKSLKNLKRDWGTPQYRKQVKEAIQSVRESPVYYLGDYNAFEDSLNEELTGGKIFKKHLGDIILPFPEIVVLFDLNNNHDRLKIGAIVKQFSGDVISIQIMISSKRNYWILFPIFRMYSLVKSMDEVGFFSKNLRSEEPVKEEVNKNTNLAVATSVPSILSDKFIYGEYTRLMQTGCTVANYLLIVLGYKNIVSETMIKERPTPMNKKKINPLYEYRVLKYKPPKSSKNYGYLEPLIDSKGLVPFIRVPAHKKTYTEEGGGMWGNPKLIGTWLIPSYVKGSKQVGFVTKDYDVTERV